MARGTSNANVRGSSRDRIIRKMYLMRVYESDHGQGTVRCFRCGCLLTIFTLTIDRIKPGRRGGKYVRNNIRPACSQCNIEISNDALKKEA